MFFLLGARSIYVLYWIVRLPWLGALMPPGKGPVRGRGVHHEKSKLFTVFSTDSSLLAVLIVRACRSWSHIWAPSMSCQPKRLQGPLANPKGASGTCSPIWAQALCGQPRWLQRGSLIWAQALCGQPRWFPLKKCPAIWRTRRVFTYISIHIHLYVSIISNK